LRRLSLRLQFGPVGDLTDIRDDVYVCYISQRIMMPFERDCWCWCHFLSHLL